MFSVIGGGKTGKSSIAPGETRKADRLGLPRAVDRS
jgi:hypothetical protein